MKTSLLCIVLLLVVGGAASAQVATGSSAFGAFGGGPFDTVNLGNLNTHFEIPVFGKAGRGLPFNYALTYDSSVWSPHNSNGTSVWTNGFNWGWKPESANAVGYITASEVYYECGYPNQGSQYIKFTQWVYHNPFTGVATSFPGLLEYDSHNCDGGGTSTLTATAEDGSGEVLNAGFIGGGYVWPLTITGKDGKVSSPLFNPPTGVSFSAATQTDPNGNQISVSAAGVFTDTLGTAALTVTGSATVASPVKLSYTAPSGANAVFTINYTSYNIKTNFGCSGVAEYSASSVALISSIDLPDGTQYLFTYEPTPSNSGYNTGRIAKVTLPTGGSISYNYTGANNGIVCADGSTLGLTRTLSPDGITTNNWTYSRSNVSGAHWTTTITTPHDDQNTGSVGDDTVIDFQKDGNTAVPTYLFYETQRKSYQALNASGTLLLTTLHCYNGNYASCVTATVNSPITQVDAYHEIPSGQTSAVQTSFNSYGLLTDQKEYGYGVTTGTVPSSTYLLRETAISYATIANGIVNRPHVITVTAGGSTAAQTTYGYDAFGNQTSASYQTAGSSSIATSTSYNATGTINVFTDLNGATTTYNYTGTSCNNSFPTSISEPLSLSRSMTWNCVGGVETSVSDENGSTTSASYTNPYFWRPDSTADQVSNITTVTHGTSPETVESSLPFNGTGSIVDILNTYDGFGRLVYFQRKQSPSSSTYDSVELVYDDLDRPYQSSMPYAASASTAMGSGTPVTTRTYDGLGRQTKVVDGGAGTVNWMYTKQDVLQDIVAPSPEHDKQRQFEYDGLGRLMSVCELTSSSASPAGGTCSQVSSTTGYYTTYTRDPLNNLTGVTQNAQATGSHQTRTYLYDRLSRLISEKTPETNSNAVTYVYDTDSICGTSNGDLVKRTDAVGNVTCYKYDSLHRLTSVTYPSGSYASATPTKCYVYDAATVNSQTMPNAKGRLAEAYTGSGSSCPISTKTTDLGFGYSVRGEVSDVYQSTAHSSGYYHVSATYWAHGLLNILTPNISGLPTFKYGGTGGSNLDGEGRPKAVTVTSGTNPVSGVTYTTSGTTEPIGSLTQVTLGSSDTDSFQYDPNTGRITQFKATIGASQNQTGNLTWNANGSLNNLVIADGANSGNAQTCNYTHDDLGRIASANCGATIWNQNFTYDPFGNITKTVPGGSTGGSFQPTYSSATNRYTALPGMTPSYDSNGNLLNDSYHTYTWDAENKAISMDGTGVGLTYDAFGRMVEQGRGSAHTEILYGPGGAKLALMNGQTLNKAFVPLPGGPMAVYNSTSLAYYRHADWLGSSRVSTTGSRGLNYDAAFSPFGEDYAQKTGSGGSADLSFTGQNQDTEAGGGSNGQYDFLFRQYSAVQGRWISPDPAGLAVVDPGNPQSWNRYGYVLNNPLGYVDPSGLGCTDPYDGLPCVLTFVTVNGDGSGDIITYNGFGGQYHAPGEYALLSQGSESRDRANNCQAPFLCKAPPAKPTATISAAYPPTEAQIKAACTVVAIGLNNGFGNGPGDSSSASNANGVIFQQYTQYPRPTTMNPSALNVSALGPLAAPGLFVQASYQNCLSSFGVQ